MYYLHNISGSTSKNLVVSNNIVNSINSNLEFNRSTLLAKENENNQYVNLSYASIIHIISNKQLTSREKLFYITADFYAAKTLSANSHKKRSVIFTAKKFGEILGICSNSALRLEQKLENLGYFKIKRTKNNKNRNNVNEIYPTLPDDVFKCALEVNIRKKIDFCNLPVSSLSELKNINTSSICKRSILDKIGQYISFNMSFIKKIISSNNLTALEKICSINLYIVIYLLSTKNKTNLYFGHFELIKLQKELNISKSTLCRLLKKLQEYGFITKEQFFVQEYLDKNCFRSIELSPKQSNRFDKSIWCILIMIPNHENLYIPNNDILETGNQNSSDNLIEDANPNSQYTTNIISNNRAVEATHSYTSLPYVTMEVSRISPIIKRNKIIRIDKDKEEKNSNPISHIIEISKKSISIFYNLFDKEKSNKNCKLDFRIKPNNSITDTNKTELAQKENEERKKNIKTDIKSKFDIDNYQYQPKKLIDFYPLNKVDGDILIKESGKIFSLNFINSILFSIASKMDKLGVQRLFKHKSQFLKYFSLVLKNEIRNENKENEIEKYFSKIENDAIINRTDSRQLKAKLANILPENLAFHLLKNMICINIFDYHINKHCDKFNYISKPKYAVITLLNNVKIDDCHKEKILNEIKAVYGTNVSFLKFRLKSDEICFDTLNQKLDQIYSDTIEDLAIKTENTTNVTQNTANDEVKLQIKEKETNSRFIDDETLWGQCLNQILQNNPALILSIKTLYDRLEVQINKDEKSVSLLLKDYIYSSLSFFHDHKLDNYKYLKKVEFEYLDLIKLFFTKNGYSILKLDTKYRNSLPNTIIGNIRKAVITDQFKDAEDRTIYSNYSASIANGSNSVTIFVNDNPEFVNKHLFDIFSVACEKIGCKLYNIKKK